MTPHYTVFLIVMGFHVITLLILGDLDKDKQKAIYWLTESSKRGNLQAVGRLSELQAG